MGRTLDSTSQDDAALLAACLAGDESAWGRLVERYSRLVFSIALRSGLTREDADDVVQNVFTIALRRLETLRDSDRLSSWLVTTAHRESWRVARRSPETPIDDVFEPVDPAPDTDDRVIAREQAALIHEALARIDVRCRVMLEALFLRDERPSYDTLAADLGIAVGSVGPIRARCLDRLRTALAEIGVVDGVA